MKAERRHELKQNSLVSAIERIPAMGREHAARIGLGLIILALIGVMIRNHIVSSSDRLTFASQQVAQANEAIRELKYTLRVQPGDDMAAIMQNRRARFAEALTAINDAMSRTAASDSQVRAQALIAKGDLAFEMENLPPLPGASTRPELRPVDTDDVLLKGTAEAYQQVLSNYSSQLPEVIAAHFGLAAVAENRAVLFDAVDNSQWDIARQQYQAVIDSDAGPSFKALAQKRLLLLVDIQKPIVSNWSSTPATAPAAAATSSTQPSTR